ncbi:osmotically-inducible lipoprotein OsmB [Dickeya zeae]|uniref:osmotically-inducible lipoprotein OsmB n=1 Tax=Dickeya zeae TaxID=204042 RepID=UPI0003A84E89|nr:osmotically-inducible lipoprotein OsmB [Dickeya zeae]
MQINKKFTTTVLAMVLVSTLAGCAGMNKRQRNTAIGAGIGAVGGAVLTNGSALGTVGGAAVGGIIGHQTTR